MCKINVKKSILEIVEKNNLEILKIDLVNSDEAFARRYNEDRNIFSCKVYITLEDFEVDSVFWHDDVLGTVYCQDKDNTSYLKVVINDGTGYTVTKITPGGKCIGIYQFNAGNTNFLKYYKICSQSEWESAIDRLNIWFKDASLKIKKL